MQMNEINHKPQSYAVREISHNAGQQQRTRTQYPIVIARRAKEVEQDGDGSSGCLLGFITLEGAAEKMFD